MNRSIALFVALATVTGCAIPTESASPEEGSLASKDDSLLAICDPKICVSLSVSGMEFDKTTAYARTVYFTLTTSGSSPSEYQTSERADFSDATWKPIYVNGVRQPYQHTLTGASGNKTVYARVRLYNAYTRAFVVSNTVSDTIQFIETSVRHVNCADAFVQARSRGFTFTATNANTGGACRIEQYPDHVRMVADGWAWDDANCTFKMFGGRRLRTHWTIRSLDVVNTTGTTTFDSPRPLDGGYRSSPAFTSTERKKSWELVPAIAWCNELVLEGPVYEDTMMAFSDANP